MAKEAILLASSHLFCDEISDHGLWSVLHLLQTLYLLALSELQPVEHHQYLAGGLEKFSFNFNALNLDRQFNRAFGCTDLDSSACSFNQLLTSRKKPQRETLLVTDFIF
jgi:hypothetical protein